MTIFEALFNPSVFASAFRLATPLVFGSIGGCFTKKVGIFFIAYESIMLISAFFSAWGSYLFGGALFGLLFGIAAALVTGFVFGLLVINFKADSLIVSIALNYGAWAITTQLLVSVFNTRGSFFSTDIINYKEIEIPFITSLNNETLNILLNNKLLIVYLWPIVVVLAYIFIYKTSLGLRMRGVGINALASTSAGINVNRYKWLAVILLSVALGAAGSYLPLGGVSMFAESMTAGRGSICIAAVLIGNGNPLVTGLVALLFAYSSAIALTLTSLYIPTQIVESIPFAIVIVVFFVYGIKNFRVKSRLA